MDDQTPPPLADRLLADLDRDDAEDAIARLEDARDAADDERKELLQSLKATAAERPAAVEPLCPALAPFLEDDERPVRLRAAKLLVALAEASPDAVEPVVPALADRLADDGEFYYVRARSAEALGYVALDRPDEVASPGVLADLRVGLSFDDAEVRNKLAKALEHVAIGDPTRLDHLVARLAEHLDDESELVRYHLTTALVAIGCEAPDRLAEVADALGARLADEDPYVRGRAAEALGLLAGADANDSVPAADLEAAATDEPFAADRVAFALASLDDTDPSEAASEEIGSLDGVRETTGEAVDAITSPDRDRECPHCGLALPADSPPLCPRCGAPH